MVPKARRRLGANSGSLPEGLYCRAASGVVRFSGISFQMEVIMYLKLIAAVLAVAFMAAGCNTMEGAGKDVKSVGQSLENSADKHKR
jgi:predicted small secreted protein